jgi:hypothetical protein
MSELTPIPPPANDPAAEPSAAPNAQGDHTQQQQRRQRSAPPVLDAMQCLGGLSQLPGLLATGFLAPKVVNAMRAVYQTLLQHSARAGATAMPALATEDVLSVLRENPERIRLFEPLLTDEQLEMITREINDEKA